MKTNHIVKLVTLPFIWSSTLKMTNFAYRASPLIWAIPHANQRGLLENVNFYSSYKQHSSFRFTMYRFTLLRSMSKLFSEPFSIWIKCRLAGNQFKTVQIKSEVKPTSVLCTRHITSCTHYYVYFQDFSSQEMLQKLSKVFTISLLQVFRQRFLLSNLLLAFMNLVQGS